MVSVCYTPTIDFGQIPVWVFGFLQTFLDCSLFVDHPQQVNSRSPGEELSFTVAVHTEGSRGEQAEALALEDLRYLPRLMTASNSF